MKVTKSQLKELIRHAIVQEIKIPFSSSHIKQLKRAFKDMKGTLPDNNPLVQQIVTLLKKTDKKVLKQIIETYGYNVKVIEESVALAYEGLVDNDLTGIAISMGAGMCNICVMYQGMSALSFSVARGGDWIDENVASDCGVTKAKVISIKESSKNLDLTKSAINDIYNEGSDEYNIINAIRSYYGALVNYLLTNLKHQFENAESVPNFPNAIPIVFGGGTSLVKGFMEVVGEQFNQDEFPIEVEKFTLVEDAHTAVARGCLSEAQLIEEEEGETNKKSN